MNIKKLIKKTAILLSAMTIISLYSSSYIIKINETKNYNFVINSEKNKDFSYPESNKPSNEWLNFFQKNGYLSSFDTLVDWEWNEIILILNLSDSDLPQTNLGITNIGYLRFSGIGLTHLDFLQGVSSGTFLFHDTSITNVNSMSSVTNSNVIYLHNNNINDISGLRNLRTVENGFFIFNNPNLTDISPLSNLVYAHGYIGIRVDDPAQYTKKPKMGSNFCNGIISGEINAYVSNKSSILLDVTEICEP